jgi:hypothetical protein
MSALYDGNRKINTIHILGMYRQNEAYLSFLFKRFHEWEVYYHDVTFIYYFLENNSKDNTRELLKNFIKDRPKSKLVLYNLKKDYENVGDGTNFNRISTLTKLRNLLIDKITPLPKNEWALFIDSNIYFQDDILSSMFSQTKPTDENIGMMSAYAQQLFLPKLHSPKLTKPAILSHYYDTYSIIDTNNKSFFPKCPFEKCKVCTRKLQNTDKTMNTPRIKKDQPVAEVHSCFGGFVLIKTDVLNHPHIRWSTMCLNLDEDKSTCEHWTFCDRLRSIMKMKIVVLQNVDAIYRTI